MAQGTFAGWTEGKTFGFIKPDDGTRDVFLHMNDVPEPAKLMRGTRVRFEMQTTPKGARATNIAAISATVRTVRSSGDSATSAARSTDQSSSSVVVTAVDDEQLLSEEIEDLDTVDVREGIVREIAAWKLEAKAEDNDRYFWHVQETDQIASGEKYFVIGRKGTGKTAICEYFNRTKQYDVFTEKLSFKNFPFNELYAQKNPQFTPPNQFITIWKYLIYSSVCRLMLKNQDINLELRSELSSLYGDEASLSRRLSRWVGKEFGVSLFGLSAKLTNTSPHVPKNWIEHVDFLEDLLLRHSGTATYFILFDELDEDYRDLAKTDQLDEYVALITSLFKAVQDVRTIFGREHRLFPVIFLRDDIYDLVQDSDKNKWRDFRIDLNWDTEKIKRVIAFRISRSIDATCTNSLSFGDAWSRVFGKKTIRVGQGKKNTVNTFEFIERSTLLRPRDFVAYLQSCASYSLECERPISPYVIRQVDKKFSNYLRQELTDELFAVLPDVANIFDAISQLRKWNFSIAELEKAYRQQVDNGFIKQANVKFVLQVLFLFSVIGNTPRVGRYVFRYKNQEARLNFNERVVVHRGLFKALQIL